MPLNELLTPDAVIPALRVNGKKQALQEMSERAAEVSELPAREIFDSSCSASASARPGWATASPFRTASSLKCPRIFGVFARLERPIDFEALDGLPVDLIFLLVAPESAGADHLKALAMIARLLRNSSLAAQLRATRDASAIYSVLTQSPTSNAA